MKEKQKFFIIYTWASVLVWIAIIFMVSKFVTVNISSPDIVILGEKLAYLLAFILLVILIYRSILGTLIIKLERLSKAKSKREQKEDYEFVRLIEFWVGVSSLLFTVIISIANVSFRYSIGIFYVSLSDVLTYALGSIAATLVAYYYPILLDKEYEIIAEKS